MTVEAPTRPRYKLADLMAKMLDWQSRNVRIKETVPQYIVDEALARIEAIFFE